MVAYGSIVENHKESVCLHLCALHLTCSTCKIYHDIIMQQHREECYICLDVICKVHELAFACLIPKERTSVDNVFNLVDSGESVYLRFTGATGVRCYR